MGDLTDEAHKRCNLTRCTLRRRICYSTSVKPLYSPFLFCQPSQITYEVKLYVCLGYFFFCLYFFQFSFFLSNLLIFFLCFVWYFGHHRWYPNGTLSDLTVGDQSPFFSPFFPPSTICAWFVPTG
ncbi:unnamed protein product [Pylaiella littoralis]